MSNPVILSQQSQPVQFAQPGRQTYRLQGRQSNEEDRAWSRLYRTVGNASTAEEVVKALDADPQAKQSHLALYLQARTTMRHQKAIVARNERVGASIRGALTFLFVSPVRLLRSTLSASAELAVEVLPPVAQAEPAQSRATTLKTDPAFANAKKRFAAGGDATSSPAAESGDSRRANAA